MNKIIVLLGPSNSGKDYLAETLYPDYQKLKLNQPFKDEFEIDHGLPAGACNDKSIRSQLLVSGPLAGKTIQEAMVQAYVESEGDNPESYGYKFRDFTLKLLSKRLPMGDVVITDLRKITDAQELNFLTRRWNRKTVVVIHSNKAQPQESDKDLLEVQKLLVKYQWNLVNLTNNY